MEQEPDLDAVIRQRIRSLRLARGWTLDTLAARCFLSPSTLSRIETGHRRIALDQLVPIAKALGTTLDDLVDTADDDDVVIRPRRTEWPGAVCWLLSGDGAPHGVTVAKMRLTRRATGGQLRVHPGREWFTVLSGAVELHLGERRIVVEKGQSAEFSTMQPHALIASGGPAELLSVMDHDGERAHLSLDAAGS
jgi:transcriptional regulator with XRE-family HTH domain